MRRVFEEPGREPRRRPGRCPRPRSFSVVLVCDAFNCNFVVFFTCFILLLFFLAFVYILLCRFFHCFFLYIASYSFISSFFVVVSFLSFFAFPVLCFVFYLLLFPRFFVTSNLHTSFLCTSLELLSVPWHHSLRYHKLQYNICNLCIVPTALLQKN